MTHATHGGHRLLVRRPTLAHHGQTILESGDAYEVSSTLQTMPVNTLLTSTFGLHHLSGNVAEWTLDSHRFNAYDGESENGIGEDVTDPLHENRLSLTGGHSIRGGWRSTAINLSQRVSYLRIKQSRFPI